VRLNCWCESVIIETDPEDSEPLRLAIGFLSQTLVVGASSSGARPSSGVVRLIRAPFGVLLPFYPFLCATAALVISWFKMPFAMAVAAPLILGAAVPPVRRALRILISERRTNVDFLDSVAILVSVARGQLFTAALIGWMIALGDYIRDRTAARSRKSVRKLLEFQDALAWVVSDGRISRVPSATVAAGQKVVVYAGEMIPVDGRIVRGRASIDQKTLTGESLPIEKNAGEDVFASTVVRDGKLLVNATRVGEATLAARMVQLVDAAPVGETRMQNHAERLGDRLVAPALLLSGGLFAATGNLDRLLSMLIVDYGTGIRVAAPTTILAAMSQAARKGIIIKSGRHMEQLGNLHTVVFDKTGTLTCGRPELGEVVSFDHHHFPSRKILSLAAAAEARLKHPVAEAILARARQEGVELPDRSNASFQVGLGVQASINGYTVHVGNEKFLNAAGVRINGHSASVSKMNETGWSALLFAVDGEVKGVIPYADTVRGESGPVVTALREFGVRKVVMITGDNSAIANAVASRLGVDDVYSNALPADKAEIVRAMQARGEIVAMVGDGINDAAALAYADVGVSMKHGADIARETAGVVLMEDNLSKLVSAIQISRRAMRTIRQNYGIIAAMNTFAMGLAIPTGLVSPNISTLVSNGSAILASLNAIRPLLID
jgi:cation-transporting P-type ATPase C